MSVKTLNCPTCGASLTSDETRCRYCSSRLATIACGKCFGMMFVGSKFCPHCGAAAAEPAAVQEPKVACPGCKEEMRSIRLGQTCLHECDRCHGLWIDTESFRRICAEHERQSDVLGAAAPAPSPSQPAKVVRYRACPVCKRLMNRYNFANASRVVIDACKAHGVWFDRDELRQIIEFIRAGGTDLSRQRERERKTEKQRWLESQRQPIRDEDGYTLGSSIAATGGLTGFFSP